MSKGLVNIAPNFTDENYNFWDDNMQLSIMQPFSDLYNRDETPNKTVSSKEMVVIFFMMEPDPEKNKFYRIPEKDRLTMLKETYYSDFNEHDAVIFKCMEQYPHLCLTSAERALKEEIDSMVNRANFIRNFDYSENTLDSIKKFEVIRKMTPALFEAYEKLEQKFLKEKSEARVRGGRKKSKSENKLL